MIKVVDGSSKLSDFAKGLIQSVEEKINNYVTK